MSYQSHKKEITVSIILSVYNGEKYLSEALESVLVQTFTNWELILVNDCSTDSSGEIAYNYAKKDERIRYFSMSKNSKLIACLNFAIEQSQGKYIARFDADDIMMPDRLEQQVNFLESHPDIGLLGTAVESIDENGDFICFAYVETEDEKIKRLLPKKNPFYHPSVMYRANVIKTVGAYSSQYPRAEDYELFIRFAQQSKIANLPKPLIKYRTLSTSISHKSIRGQSWDVFKLKLSAIQKGYHPLSAIIYTWKHLIYVFSPDWLIRKQLAYRIERGKKQKEFILQ